MDCHRTGRFSCEQMAMDVSLVQTSFSKASLQAPWTTFRQTWQRTRRALTGGFDHHSRTTADRPTAQTHPLEDLSLSLGHLAFPYFSLRREALRWTRRRCAARTPILAW